MTIWALFQSEWTSRYFKGLVVAFVVSSSYLGWGVVAQAWALDLGKRELQSFGINPSQLMATPVPLSSLFWRIIAVDKSHEYSVFVPLLGGQAALTTYRNARIPERLKCWMETALQSDGPLKTLSNFSDGFFRLDIENDKIRYSDLRMGLHQTYAFQFNLAHFEDQQIRASAVERVSPQRQFPGDREWLKNGILGNKSLRPVEQANLLTPDSAGPRFALAKSTRTC